MNRGQYPPFAKGSEDNLLIATAAFLTIALLKLITQSKFFSFLLWIVTPMWLLVLYFFRDPDRIPPMGDHLVISPADGVIVDIVNEHDPKFLDCDITRVSIFLSIFDVHVQRNPINGRVVHIHHQAGQNLQAFRPEASDINEYIAMHIHNDTYGDLIVKQIAGIMARRCVNHHQIGDTLIVGERFGMIRFGSRVDLFLPTTADIFVNIGDKVEAGHHIIASLQPEN